MRLEALTGARFFAALWVLLMHFAVVGALGPMDGTAHGLWLGFWVATGGASVGFFFILSGFVLAHTYAHTAVSSTPLRFWRARVLRIYPTYVLALLLTTGSALWLGQGGSSPWNACTLATCGPSWLLSLVPVQAWFADATVQQTWNAPGWSIAAEAFFYLLFPFLVMPVVRWTRRWGWRMWAALWATQNLCFAAISTAITYANPPAQADMALWLERLPLLRLPEFLLGISAWTLWSQQSKLPASQRHASVWVFLGLLIALCALWFLPVPAAPGWLHLLASAKAYSLAAPLFALLIMHLAQAPHGLARALASPPLVLLGEASYALYILHWCLLQSLFAVSRGFGVAPPVWAGYATVLLAVAVSVVVHVTMEQTLRRKFGQSRSVSQ